MATAAPVQPATPQRGIKALLARHPLVSVFMMAYAFSWIVRAALEGLILGCLLSVRVHRNDNYYMLCSVSTA